MGKLDRGEASGLKQPRDAGHEIVDVGHVGHHQIGGLQLRCQHYTKESLDRGDAFDPRRLGGGVGGLNAQAGDGYLLKASRCLKQPSRWRL